MKKMITTLIFILLFQLLPAPGSFSFIIILPEEINMYDPLIKAIVWVEVKEGKDLHNEIEDAVGYFQIRPIRVEDYNKLTGSNYKLEDFYDYELSRKMFLYYAAGKSFEQAAKNWNGSGPKTIEYWKLVKSRL